MCVSVSSWVLDPNEFQSSKNLSLSHECTLSVGLITGGLVLLRVSFLLGFQFFPIDCII